MPWLFIVKAQRELESALMRSNTRILNSEPETFLYLLWNMVQPAIWSPCILKILERQKDNFRDSLFLFCFDAADVGWGIYMLVNCDLIYEVYIWQQFPSFGVRPTSCWPCLIIIALPFLITSFVLFVRLESYKKHISGPCDICCSESETLYFISSIKHPYRNNRL